MQSYPVEVQQSLPLLQLWQSSWQTASQSQQLQGVYCLMSALAVLRSIMQMINKAKKPSMPIVATQIYRRYDLAWAYLRLIIIINNKSIKTQFQSAQDRQLLSFTKFCMHLLLQICLSYIFIEVVISTHNLIEGGQDDGLIPLFYQDSAYITHLSLLTVFTNIHNVKSRLYNSILCIMLLFLKEKLFLQQKDEFKACITSFSIIIIYKLRHIFVGGAKTIIIVAFIFDHQNKPKYSIQKRCLLSLASPAKGTCFLHLRPIFDALTVEDMFALQLDRSLPIESLNTYCACVFKITMRKGLVNIIFCPQFDAKWVIYEIRITIGMKDGVSRSSNRDRPSLYPSFVLYAQQKEDNQRSSDRQDDHIGQILTEWSLQNIQLGIPADCLRHTD